MTTSPKLLTAEAKVKTSAVKWEAVRVYGYDKDGICIETIEHPVRTRGVGVIPINVFDALAARVESAERERDAALAQVEANAVDAERYRWMREYNNADDLCVSIHWNGIDYNLRGQRLDEAVDAARASVDSKEI